MLAMPQFTLRLEQMVKTLSEVWAILDGESHQVRLEVWVLLQQHFKAHQVRLEVLGTTPDSAEAAEQVLSAKVGTVEPDPIDGVVVPKHEVVTALPEPLGSLTEWQIPCFTFWQRFHIIGHIECTIFCFTVSIQPTRQCFDTF